MAEDDWAKKRKRSEDSSSDESNKSSESSQESENPTMKTRNVFHSYPQIESKSTLLNPRKMEHDFQPIESASSSGLHKRKCSKEIAKGVKRRLWDVDRNQVDIDLDRELKRMHKEETLDKSVKWNFDFEREAPLTGEWSWLSTKSAPDFYKTKEATSKFKPIQPPTISKWSTDETTIHSTISPREEKVIRPKPIRPSTSEPGAAVQKTVSMSKESIKSSPVDSISGIYPKIEISEIYSKPKSLSTYLDTNITPMKYTSTPIELSSAVIETEVISSSATSSCSTKGGNKTRSKYQMILRPRKKQKLDRSKRKVN